MGILVDSINEERKRRQQQRRTYWERKLTADADAAERRKKQGDSFSAPAPKTAEEKEAELNLREANRSVKYSMIPEVRAGAIKRAEASGDTEKARELSFAKDIERWADSTAVREAAQGAHDYAFRVAVERGDESPHLDAEKAGQAILDTYKNMARKARDDLYNYRQEEKKRDLENVRSSPDFNSSVRAGSTITPHTFGKASEILNYMNGDETYRAQKHLIASKGATQYWLGRNIDEMSEDEKNVIRYYASKGEMDKVKEYYELLERDLNRRVTVEQNNTAEKNAYNLPVLGAVANVASSFGTPAGYVKNLVQTGKNAITGEYEPTDTNAPTFSYAHAARATSDGVTQRAYDAAGGGTWGEIASFAAGTGLSLANYLSKLPLGPTGAMIAMSADTAGQKTLDVLERGGTQGEALFLSTAAAALEALTEKLPLENLFKTAKQVGKKGLKQAIKSSLKQAGMEATEEIVSEIANTALDIAVMRDKSEYQKYISGLVKDGTSRAEAEKEAFFQYFGKNVLLAGAGGALSGGIMGGGASAISGINTAINRSRAGGGFTPTEYSKKITNKQIRALRAIGRALGVNISIGAPTGNGEGAYNGYYQNGNIVIAQDAENPLEVVLCHEITHHMKITAPAEYNAFLELAVNASESLSSTEKSELINRYKTEYSKGTQTEYSDAQALDEIAADFASRIVNDVKMFDRLAKSNRGAAVRFIDGIKDFIAKVKSTFSADKAKADTASQEKYGARVSELETAVAQFESMLATTEEAVASGNINTAGTLDFAQNGEYNYDRIYAFKKTYWHPDLSKRQLERLRMKIRSDAKTSNNSFTDKANWLFCDIEGLPVLAIYSTENTEEPTLLYESKDAQAEREKEILLDILEGLENGENFNAKSRAVSTVSSGGWMQQNGSAQNSTGGLGGTRGSSNAGVLQRQSKSKPARAFINVIENLTAERGRVNNKKEEAVDVSNTSAASSLYAQSGNINTAGTDADGGRMYSIKGNLLSDLQYILTHKNENNDDELLIGTTSDFLVNELGAKPLKVTMPKTKAYAAMATEAEAKSATRYDSELNYHGFGPDLLYEVLTASETPVVAFVAENGINKKTGEIEDRSDRIVLVTDKVKDGNNIVAIMQVDADGRYAGKQISANKDITVYDRSSIASDISKAMADHRLLYFDKKRSQTITAGRPGSNSPVTIQNVDFKDNIARFWANVNWKKSGGSSNFEAPATEKGTALENAYNKALEKSNRQNSLKTGDLLSPDYGKTAVTAEDPSASGESYIDETGLDTYFDDLGERAQTIRDKNIAEANATLMRTLNARKKTLPEKVKESASFLKRKIPNSGDAIRKIEKKTNDGHLYGAFNRARSSMNIVSDMLRNKQTNIRGQKVGESLEGILTPIKEKGEEYFYNFNLYLLHKHNVARMSIRDTRAEEMAWAALRQFTKKNPDFSMMQEEDLERTSLWDDNRGRLAREYIELRRNLRAAEEKNKPIFFNNEALPLNADDSRYEAAKLLRKNPDFAEFEAKVRKYLDNLMEYRVDSGLITREEAEYLRKKYPDYIPTYRNTESVQKQMQGKTNTGTATGRAKGGNEPILPLDVALAEMTKKVIRSGQKNIFANKIFDLYNSNSKAFDGYITDVREGGRDIDAEIDSFGEEPTFDNTVSFHMNGKSVELTVTPELFEAFDALSKVPKEQPPWLKTWGKIVDVYKKLITTYDPTFIIRNGFKDLFDGIFQSKDTVAFLKNYGRAYKEILRGGEMWELYQAAGGLYSSRFEELQNEGITERGGKLAKVKEKLAFANMAVEQAPRLAEFISVVEKGDADNPDTISDALLAAAEVTTNFGESGTWGKVLNKYAVPFLNPAIQGTAKIARTFTESKTAKEWLGLAVKCTIMGLSAGFLNDLINGDDEDYENLPDRTKDNYFLFPTGDGKFLKLPKGRVMAALGVVADRVRDTMTGEKVDAGEAFSRIAENILPQDMLSNNIFEAFRKADLFNDESRGRTWYGTDIENDSLQALPAGERFDSSTDYISKALGKTLGVSPKKLNYILEQYTGGVGRMILPMLTPSEQKGDSVVGNIGLGAWSALTSSFMTDSKLSNKISGEFYDAVNAAEQAKNSAKGTLADKIVYKHLNRERNMAGTYNSKVRAAEVDKNLTSKERQAAVRAASAERTAYQKTILENIDKYRANVDKFLKKYPGSDEDKKLEYAYREANRAVYGEEYAIRVNGGSDVYKKAEEKVKRGKTTWKKYYDEYFGKTERRFDAVSDRFNISYAEFEKIESAISKNGSKAEEISAIEKLGYKNSIARRIYTLYHDTK